MASCFVLAFCPVTETWLAQLRAKTTSNPLTWGLPGGGMEPGERAIDTAIREFQEEVGVTPPIHELYPVLKRGGRTLFLWPVRTEFQADPKATFAHESERHQWFPLDVVPQPATRWMQKMHKEALEALVEAKVWVDRRKSH